ncbi:uncharacterized protein LOC117176976 [Belonocnema kinseyi]|uniref:uncharacterized protein LOC117176976 n=1 Tax=Belonocnema kinseyi TaxID=2817044 RepID=UPI00143DEB24|nr:uncharacterized protein LOC117176976 [Belonocnema kinseyi]
MNSSDSEIRNIFQEDGCKPPLSAVNEQSILCNISSTNNEMLFTDSEILPARVEESSTSSNITITTHESFLETRHIEKEEKMDYVEEEIVSVNVESIPVVGFSPRSEHQYEYKQKTFSVYKYTHVVIDGKFC